MTSVVYCPHCRGQVANNPNLAGQVAGCPYCQRQFTLPAIPAISDVALPPPPEPAFPAIKSSPKLIASGGGQFSKQKKGGAWGWVVGGIGATVFFCCGVPVMFNAFAPPTKETHKKAEQSSWDRAWASLPKKPNGATDWENVDSIDLETASSYDYAAGEEIRKLWQEFGEQRIRTQSLKVDSPKKRFTTRQYEQLLACDESFVEAFLGVPGVESASSRSFKTVTYQDDYGAVISVGYRYQKSLSGQEVWQLISKAQSGLP